MGVEICDSIALGLRAPSHPLDSGHPVQASSHQEDWSECPWSALWPPDVMGRARKSPRPGRYLSHLPTHHGREEAHSSEAGVCVWKVLGSYYADLGC